MLVKSFLSFVTHDSALKILDWLFTPYPLYLNYSQYSNFPIVHGFVLKTVWSIVCLIHFSTYRSLIASLGRCWGEGQWHSLHLLSVSSLVKDDKKWKEGKDVVDLSRGSCRSAQGLAQGTQWGEALVSDLASRFVLCINYFFLKQKCYFKSNLRFLENSIQCILILLNCITIPGKQFKWGRIYFDSHFEGMHVVCHGYMIYMEIKISGSRSVRWWPRVSVVGRERGQWETDRQTYRDRDKGRETYRHRGKGRETDRQREGERKGGIQCPDSFPWSSGLVSIGRCHHCQGDCFLHS